MIYLISFFLLIFSLHIHGYCITFKHLNGENSTNYCLIQPYNNEEVIICLTCHFKQSILPFDNIILNENCSSTPHLRCVNLFFNTTDSYRNFTEQYFELINKIFYTQIDYLSEKNALHIHILYDTLKLFSLDLFQSLDKTPNRTYNDVTFDLQNRIFSERLEISKNLENMTLRGLQINIYCHPEGLYQYNYRPVERKPLKPFLKCEIPIRKPTNNRFKTILMITIIILTIIIPCLLLLICLYILCTRKSIPILPRESFTSDMTLESTLTEES